MKFCTWITLTLAVLGTLTAAAPPFTAGADWKSSPWRTHTPRHDQSLQFSDGTLRCTNDGAEKIAFGPAEPLAQSLPAGTMLTFSVEAKGAGQPKNYEYGMVLTLKYEDNTTEKWQKGSNYIPFPREIPDFKTFTASIVAAKPVKSATILFFFNGKCQITLRNPQFTTGTAAVPKAPAKPAASPAAAPAAPAAAVSGDGNLLVNAGFRQDAGKLPGWNFHGPAAANATVADGVVGVNSSKQLFELDSVLVTPKEPEQPVRFGLEAEIDAKPSSWRYCVILDVRYSDGSRGKWADSEIKLPRKTEGFQRFEAEFRPAKPVKSYQFKLLFEAEGSLRIRRPFVATEQLSRQTAAAVQAKQADDGNLAPNPGLIFADGKLDQWSIGTAGRYMRPLAEGGFSVKLPAQTQISLASRVIELNQQKPVTLRYGVTYRGKNFPVSYHHGLLLDKVVYMDGTTEGWGATHFIFRFQSDNWSREAIAWLPPKPVKSLRLYFLFKGTAEADFALKDVFLRQDPDAFSTANAALNFDSTPTNLVSNGNFEIVKAGDPKNWIPFFETHPLNMSLKTRLDMALDKSVRHSGQYSMRLSGSQDSIAGAESTVASIIDDTREFTFSGWIKAENATGNNFLEVKFLRSWAPCGIGSAAGNELNRVHNRADTVGVYRTPVTAGTHDWKKFEVSMKPPAGANLVTFRIYSINNCGTVWIDDLEFDGFGNAPREILYSQLGYPADGAKKIILRSRKAVSGSFEVIDENGESVFSGTLRERGKDIWDCFNCEADFSAFTAPGRYFVRFNNSDGTYTSESFEISKDFYASIIESSRDFMYHMRCGFDIPGFHRACHLDDGQLRSKNNLLAGGKVIGHHDCSGGWHDAGDYDKFPGPSIQPAIYFSRFGKRFHSDALLDEGAWGARWHNKIATPKGVYYQIMRLAPNGQVIIDLCPPESETDNVPGNADDRTAVGPGHDIMVAWALAEHALATKDPAFREKCFQTSRMLYDDFLNSRKTFDQNFYMFNSSMLVKTDLAYYQLTGDKKYLEHALPFVEGTVDMVVGRIAKDQWQGIFEAHFYPWSWGIMPLEFAIDHPEKAVSAKIRKEYQALVESIVGHLQRSPHGFVEHSAWKYHFRTGFGATGHSTITNLSVATLLARAAVLYNNPEYLKLAESCFHYITGINELAASQIAGFGKKVVTSWAASSAIPGYAHGQPVKGAVLKGVSRWSGTARILPSYLNGGKSDYAIDHPAQYPAMMIAGDYPAAGGPGSQEVWETLNGNALRAIEAILDARKFFDKK